MMKKQMLVWNKLTIVKEQMLVCNKLTIVKEQIRYILCKKII